MAFLKPNTKSILNSLDIGCLAFSLPELTLLFCNAQAKQYLQTKNPKDIVSAIHATAILKGRESQSGTHSYTLFVGVSTYQLLVYPPNQKNQVTVLLIPITGSPKSLENTRTVADVEHDMVFLIDERLTIVDVQNQGKANHLQVPPEKVLGKTIASLVDPSQLNHWYLVFERAKATKAMQPLFYRTSKQIGFRFLRIAVQWEEACTGYRAWVDDISTPVVASGGDSSGFLIMDANMAIEYADSTCLDLLQKDGPALLGSDIRTLFKPFSGGSFFDLYYSPTGIFHKNLRLTTFPSPHKGKMNYTVVQVTDITDKGENRTNGGFVNLLLHFTYQLLQASSENLDAALTKILQNIGTFCAADRMYIFQCNETSTQMSCTHLWSTHAQSQPPDDLQNIPSSRYPNWYAAMEQGQEVYILSRDDLPDSWQAERELLAQYKVTSVLMEPIRSGKQLMGFVGLDTGGHSLQWSEEMRGLLYLFANILGAFFARIQSEQRLKQAIATADDLIKQREEMNRSLQSFYAKINHDTRNSLNVIHASSTLLKSTALDTVQSRYRAAIESNSLFLLHLIRDILDFSSLTGQSIVISEQQISLLDVVRNTVIAIRTLAEEKGLEVAVLWDRSIPSVVMSDPVRLSQILINLLHNAVKFTAKGSITVEGKLLDLKPDSMRVQLCVHDTGKGMDEQRVKTFFSPQGLVSIPSFGEGYGLGLGIVKQLTQALNGSIEVQSSVGKGTKFSLSLDVRLPSGLERENSPPVSLKVLVVGQPSDAMVALLALLQTNNAAIACMAELPTYVPEHIQLLFLDTSLLQTDAARKQLAAYKDRPACFLYSTVFDQEGHEYYRSCRAVQGYILAFSSPWYNLAEILTKLTIADSQEAMSGQSHGMRVLVIDDSIISQEVMRHHLQVLDVEVLTAGSGTQALNLLKDCTVDLVLTDMELPDFDGIAITERIRTFTEAKKRLVPVVVISAFISEATRQRCEAVGIDDCLLKPVGRDDLAALLVKYHHQTG